MKINHVCHICNLSGTDHIRCSEYWEIKENKEKYNEEQRKQNRFGNYKSDVIDKANRISY